MAQIWRDKKYTPLAERLVDKETGFCGQKILPSYRELMVLSAMIGFHFDKKSDVIERGFEIPQRIFDNNESDSYVYLCALQDQKTGDIFRENNDNECWKIFESYANAGLEIIDTWLLDSSGDIDGVETILKEMKIVAAELMEVDDSVSDLDTLEF
jgi:dnd system-associated protein 4